MPYWTQYLLIAGLLLLLFPCRGIIKSFHDKNRRIQICILVSIILIFVYLTFHTISDYKTQEYERRVNTEYTKCLNWNNQIEVENSRCKFGTDRDSPLCTGGNGIQKRADKLRSMFNERAEHLSIYDKEILSSLAQRTIKDKEAWPKLDNCRKCINEGVSSSACSLMRKWDFDSYKNMNNAI